MSFYRNSSLVQKALFYVCFKLSILFWINACIQEEWTFKQVHISIQDKLVIWKESANLYVVQV